MNTKYPINGRVTTLNDLVHEYGASSSWPKNSEYPLLDTSKLVSQPFQNLVFKDVLDVNNKFIGERPYEIVYFDNVYSATERDTTGKHMKIIQKSDSSVFTDNYPGGISGHEYIKAGDVANPRNITSGKYGFKFIVASQNDKKQYYYNYRTSTGEATVMYALRNIIKLLREYNSQNLLTQIQKLFIPVKNEKGDTTYPEIDNIIDKKNNNELKTDAYKYLGDFIWTYKNIRFKNYTRTEQSILNIAVHKGYLTLQNNVLSSIEDLLKDLIGNNIDNNYSYNQKSYYNQLKYYLNIFANSQRFFVSYVTGFRFGKISNKSYLQIEPVLRCDLGVLRIYESLIIISAVHDWQTALPAGKILYDTSINIILQYKVKYKNLQTYSSPITTTIGPISFNDIKKYREPTSTKTTEDKKEETIENDIWYTLKTYVGEENNNASIIKYGEKYDENIKYYAGTHYYGTTYFPALPSDEFNNIDTSISNSWYSLQDLQWPSKEVLQLPSIDDVSNSRGNPKFISPVSNLKNYEDTNNNNIFVGDAEDVIGNKGIAPFGILRIHSSLDLSDENIKVSSYYIDTSIYRCKNYYYITKDNQSSENATVACYFTPKYKSYSPYIEIPIFRSNEIIQPISLREDFSNILNAGNYYSIPSNLNTLYFTVQSGTAKTITYASGVTKKFDNNDAKYITNNTFEFYYQDQGSTDKDSWIKYTGSDITVTMAQGNNIVNHYEISFYFSKIESNYWRIKLSDINQNFYFRINKIIEEETKLSIYNLSVTDNMDGTTEYKLGIYPGKPNDLSLKYAIFIDPLDNKDFLDKQNALSIFDSTFNNQSYDVYTIDTDNNKSLYIQLISIKTSEQYISNSTKNFNNIRLYVAYPDQNNKYKFSNTTIFYGEYQDSRVKIENYINKPNIYLSFEPIYIIKTGNITTSNDDNVIDDYKHFFDPEKFKLKQITLNHSGNINTVKSEGTFINSIYSEIVYIDSDSIYIGTKKLSDIIFSDNNGINNYLFEFLIIFNNITNNKENYITISNNTDNFNIDNFNSSLKDKVFAGNNEYDVSIKLNMFILKPSYYTVSVDNTIDTSVSFNITINDLPPEYHGNDITKDNTYDLPKKVPHGTTITVNHKFKQEINPELVQIKLKNTENGKITPYSHNDTITVVVYYNIEISVTISTPDTSNNNP